MAKYDVYKLSLEIGTSKDKATLELSVLFEDGDNVDRVIFETRQRILKEALNMKDTKFLDQIKQ